MTKILTGSKKTFLMSAGMEEKGNHKIYSFDNLRQAELSLSAAGFIPTEAFAFLGLAWQDEKGTLAVFQEAC